MPTLTKLTGKSRWCPGLLRKQCQCGKEWGRKLLSKEGPCTSSVWMPDLMLINCVTLTHYFISLRCHFFFICKMKKTVVLIVILSIRGDDWTQFSAQSLENFRAQYALALIIWPLVCTPRALKVSEQSIRNCWVLWEESWALAALYIVYCGSSRSRKGVKMNGYSTVLW